MTSCICAVYARVSTDMQGESLENQISFAKEYVRRLGEEFEVGLECVYADADQSGYYTRFLQRPAIQQALTDAKEHKFHVIVFKEISRMSRDQAEHIEIVSRFTAYGVRVIAVNDNLDSAKPETLDLLGIHSAMAEMESKRISSRVSSGRKSLARRGVWAGEAPIGYVLNRQRRQLEVDHALAHIPRTIFSRFARTDDGCFKIAEYLNARAMYTKYNRRWTRVTVNQVLQNPAYIGTLCYGKTRNTLQRIFDDSGYSKRKTKRALPREEWVVVEDAHEALIDRETYEMVRERLATRSKQNPRRTKHPLSGILMCGHCNAPMIAQQRHGRGQQTYRYYVCSNKFRYGLSTCQQQNLRADDVEATVYQFLLQALWKYQDYTWVREVKFGERMEHPGGQKSSVQMMHERDVHRLQLGIERLLLDIEMDEATRQKLQRSMTEKLFIAKRELQLAQVDEADRSSHMRDATGTVGTLIHDLSVSLENDLTERHRFFHALLTGIVVEGTNLAQMTLRYELLSPFVN